MQSSDLLLPARSDIDDYLFGIGASYFLYYLNRSADLLQSVYKSTTLLVPTDEAFKRLEAKTGKTGDQLLTLPSFEDLLSNHVSALRLQDGNPMLKAINGRVWGTKLSDLNILLAKSNPGVFGFNSQVGVGPNIMIGSTNVILVDKIIFFNDQLNALMAPLPIISVPVSPKGPLSPAQIEQSLVESENLDLSKDREYPEPSYQSNKRKFMAEYFSGLRCSGANPPFNNLVLKDGSKLTFSKVMDFGIKGIAIGQHAGIYYVLKFVSLTPEPEISAEQLAFRKLYALETPAPKFSRQELNNFAIQAHAKAHELANNGSNNFFSDVYAILNCPVNPPYQTSINGYGNETVLAQTIFIYEAGNINFAEWYLKANAKQFHQAVQQWLLSFVVQSLLKYGHGDPHEANVVVLYLNIGGQWEYKIGNTIIYIQNSGFLLKMIDYDESDANNDPLDGIQALTVILGQSFPSLLGLRNQRGGEILPETMSFMDSISVFEKILSLDQLPGVLKQMPILADLFVPSDQPILETFKF